MPAAGYTRNWPVGPLCAYIQLNDTKQQRPLVLGTA
jgi:hypothetical protein